MVEIVGSDNLAAPVVRDRPAWLRVWRCEVTGVSYVELGEVEK